MSCHCVLQHSNQLLLQLQTVGNVTCKAVEERYICSDSGKKVCHENWKGSECDNCAELVKLVSNSVKDGEVTHARNVPRIITLKKFVM